MYQFIKFYVTNSPISRQRYISIPPENVKKSLVFRNFMGLRNKILVWNEWMLLKFQLIK